MEKQPIDNLFKRKLHDAEIAPGDAAWKILQRKLGNQRVVPLWTYVAVAASLLIVGAFGWWILAARDHAGNSTILAKNKTPIKKLNAPREVQQLAMNSVVPGASQLETAPSLLVGDGRQKLVQLWHTERYGTKIAQRDREGKNTTQRTSTRTPGFNPAEQNEKAEIAQTPFQSKPLGSTLSESTNKELSNVKTPTTPERTLIVSIESPVVLTTKPIQTIDLPDNSVAKSGLGGLFSKVKKIKDGEAFALSTTKTAKPGRRGFGKFYDDVKESIQNNAADE